MRQLRATGWMHNRVRMVAASFLVKDLHVEWQHGARHFLRWLRDGDLASNNHGWQWVAGSGTDAAPYFRVFNPVAQGQRFDPDGDVRPALGARAGAPARAPPRTSRGSPTTATPTATRSGSSTTPRSGPRRCGATPAPGSSAAAAARLGPVTPSIVPARFNGPPHSGNGGWTSGALAALLAPAPGRAVQVRLSAPPPLDVPLDVDGVRGGDRR